MVCVNQTWHGLPLKSQSYLTKSRLHFTTICLDCHAYAEYLRANGDVRKALTFFKVNCDEYKHAASCLESGSIMSERRRQGIVSANMPVALKYFEKGCELGLPASCYSSGMLLMAPILSDHALPRDYQKVCQNTPQLDFTQTIINQCVLQKRRLLILFRVSRT